MKIKTILAVAILALTTSTVMAQVRPVKANRAKIKQGVNSGELNKAEAARLKVQNVKLAKEVKVARADGVVTTEERKDIKQDKRQLNRRIYRQKHDAQTAR